MRLIGEKEWKKILVEADLDPAALQFISESKYDPCRRVYRENNICFKIVTDRNITKSLRLNSLEKEYEFLGKCYGIEGIPKPVKYYHSSMAEVMVTEWLPGKNVEQLESKEFSLWRIMIHLAEINYKLALKGVNQNDLQADNILINESGTVNLLDFDQAINTTFTKAFCRAFLGISMGGPPVNRSMAGILIILIKNKLPAGTMKIIESTLNILVKLKRGIFGRSQTNKKLHRLPELKEDASDNAKLLFIAWNIAQKSNASSPGSLYAYYTLEFEGYVFPGERSWEERWEVLRRITDYTGKKILELGCNMGLLSTYLLKEEGASAALAVDSDKEIIEAAKLINRAMQVQVDHLVIDFDANEDWEENLINYKPDIVFALNVLNWVNQKERFLQFLGHFNILIFEGHDSLEIETERLKNIGYHRITVLFRTERNRDVLLCEK